MPPFKDEHVLVIAPGSQSCLAQLGLPESLTPAKLRIPSRMFPAEREGEWEPYKIREKKKPTSANGDVDMGGTSNGESIEPVYEEDPDSDEGAVYPLIEGRIINMPCFLALLTHVYNLLSPTLNVHTPILLVAQPAWTVKDQERITSFVFERFKTPAFCIIDAAYATLYSAGTLATATIVDVGYQKVDVTAFVDYLPNLVGRTVSLQNAGGDAMTDTLLELLGPKGWTKDMCDQLKKSHFCEILQAGVPLPGSGEKIEDISNPAAAASTGAVASGPAVKIIETPARTVEVDTIIEDEMELDEVKVIENDGVLDIASIVASDKAREIIAQREKDKAEKAAQRKTAKDLKEKEAADAAARPIRLPNSKREKVKFWYESKKQGDPEEVVEISKPASVVGGNTENKEVQASVTDGTAVPAEAAVANDKPAATDVSAPVETQTERRDRILATKREERRKEREGQVGNSSLIRKEIEVGTERFLASTKVLGLIADAVHRTISSVEDISKRSELWDSIIVVGNGSKVRGFKDALISTLSSKYLISPSSATIFTSELPSNLTTPIGTGTNTPQREFAPSGAHGVNPLLLAATTASNPALNPNQSITSSFGHSHQNGHGGGGMQSGGHHSHGQTPTSLKLVKFPEYFPEWKDHGFEEAVFLGAQVAAKLFFIVDQGQSGCFVSRANYNDDGPTAIHQVGFCF